MIYKDDWRILKNQKRMIKLSESVIFAPSMKQQQNSATHRILCIPSHPPPPPNTNTHTHTHKHTPKNGYCLTLSHKIVHGARVDVYVFTLGFIILYSCRVAVLCVSCSLISFVLIEFFLRLFLIFKFASG